jgi:DNA-binding response OmpR family regulator
VRVLVIEDDQDVAGFIDEGLREQTYAVDVLHDGLSVGDQVAVIDYDAVVLDLVLPGRSGFQVLRDIRSRKNWLPVIVLTAKSSVDDRIAGLDAGADDYMTKPFVLAELAARLRALLRRRAPHENIIRVGDLELDTAHRMVRRAGNTIALKPKEYAVLELLMRHSDRPVPKSSIIEHVWDLHSDASSNVVEVQINSLRNKIDRGFSLPLIKTIRGVGYMLTDTVDCQPAR